MSKTGQVKKRVSLFFVFGILVLCGGFFIVSCGSGIGPQGKVQNPNAGQYAVDLSQSPGSEGVIWLVSDELHDSSTSITDKTFTVEAWVKRRTVDADDFDGAIVGRMLSHGTSLFVTDSVPKFAIKRSPTSTPGGVDPQDGGCVGIHATSTECIVSSGVTLVQDIWTHIAGVLTTEDQSGSAVGDCPTYGDWEPHLAIYIDGVLTNCANTGPASDSKLYALNPPLADYNTISIGVLGDGVAAIDTLDGGASTSWTLPFQGAVDEIRFWLTERTQSDIQACINTELGFNGTCNIMDPNLLMYFRFNTGAGHAPAELTGLGSGVKESPNTVPWDGGWVPGFSE